MPTQLDEAQLDLELCKKAAAKLQAAMQQAHDGELAQQLGVKLLKKRKVRGCNGLSAPV